MFQVFLLPQGTKRGTISNQIMKKDEWRETRREFSINDNGELIPSKVTHDFFPKSKWERKDIWDIALRCIAALSIAVPFIIFIVQRNAEIKRQRQILTFEAFSKISNEVHTLINSTSLDESYSSAKGRLVYELYPKLFLFDNIELIERVEELKNEFTLHEFFISVQDRTNGTDNFLRFHPTHEAFIHYFSNQSTTVLYEMLHEREALNAYYIRAMKGSSDVLQIRTQNKSFKSFANWLLLQDQLLRVYEGTLQFRLDWARDSSSAFKMGEDIKNLSFTTFDTINQEFIKKSASYVDYYHDRTLVLSNEIDSIIRKSNDVLSIK